MFLLVGTSDAAPYFTVNSTNGDVFLSNEIQDVNFASKELVLFVQVGILVAEFDWRLFDATLYRRDGN